MLKIEISNLKNKLSIKDISKGYYKVKVLGPFGFIKNYFRKEIDININKEILCLSTNVYTKETKSLLQSYKKILKNSFNDVDFGFSVTLEVRGVGTKVSYNKNNGELIFNLGLSHQIKYYLPKGIVAKILDDKNTIFLLMGCDRNKVLSTASKICLLKKKMYIKEKVFFFMQKKLC